MSYDEAEEARRTNRNMFQLAMFQLALLRFRAAGRFLPSDLVSGVPRYRGCDPAASEHSLADRRGHVAQFQLLRQPRH